MAPVFSTLDLRSGYWQLPMAEDSKEKTAFSWHLGLFQFKRLPFGLMNAPGEFQQFMNKILSPFNAKFCAVFWDDIVVYSKTDAEHEEQLRQIFQALQDHQVETKQVLPPSV